MKLCFPVKEISDLDSEVYGHFGSAPVFLLVDSDTNDMTIIENGNRQHAHGMCSPMAALAGKEVHVVITGGIGMGALTKLNMSGVRVFQAAARTVQENIELFNTQRLLQFQPGHVCSGHGGGCSH